MELSGTFANTGAWSGDSFRYCGNGTTDGAGVTTCATVTLAACTGACLGTSAGITVVADAYTASNGPKVSAPTAPAHLAVNPPGVLANDSDAAGFPPSVDLSTPPTLAGPCNGTVSVNADGSFTATATAPGTCTFAYFAKNSQGTRSASSATVSVTFPAGNGPVVTVLDGQDKKSAISDYRWVIEEDRTFYVDPKCTTNPPPAGCPTAASGLVPTFGTNFHTSYMPVIATGCTGQQSCESGQTFVNAAGAHVSAVCDVGDGICRAGTQQAQLDPSQVFLDPAKRYYISILPGDAGNDFANGNLTADCSKGVAFATNPTACGHGMGGAPIGALCTALPPATSCTASTARPPVTIFTQPAPFPPAKLSVFVFEDDFPLNGEQDGGGGVDVLAPNERGLGRLQHHLVRRCRRNRRCDRADDLRHVQPAVGEQPGGQRSIRSPGRMPARSRDPARGPMRPATRQDPAGYYRHDRDLSEVRVGRQDAVAAGRSGGDREPDARTLRSGGHAGRRPHRPRRGVAADQYARRPEGARLVPAGSASRASSRSSGRPAST